MSSLTMNEKFQYHTRQPSAVLKNFEFIVSERVQVNPDNSCYRSCAHGQSLLCLQPRTDEAKGSIQWKITL